LGLSFKFWQCQGSRQGFIPAELPVLIASHAELTSRDNLAISPEKGVAAYCIDTWIARVDAEFKTDFGTIFTFT
jgi:hypothetical protein